MDEKKRRDARVCGAVKVFEAAGSNTEVGVTRNLSLGGMFLVTKRRWSMGDRVALRLSHRFWSVELTAKVVHRQAEGAGLCFLEVNERTRQELRLIVHGLLADGAWYDDRRDRLRNRVSGPVVWRMGGTEVESHLRNLSPQGVFIETSNSPEIGVQIMVYLPQSDGGEDGVAGCQATVIHRSPEGFGAEFVFPPAEFLTTVNAILDSVEKAAV